MKRIIHIVLFVLLTTTVFAQGKAKYIFYFIGDGMGVNQVNATEMYLADAEENRIGVKPLVFTQFPVINMASTFSATHPVTDSAAAGTALATGEKTYNYAIGVDVQKQPLTSVAEMAKRSGKKVGITTSVSVDHATPSAFYAHCPDRNMYYEIVLDLIKANFDFHAGSGFFKPNTTFDKKEAPSIFPLLEEAGYTIARGYEEFKDKSSTAQKMILIQQPEGTDPIALPYAIDQKEGDLTLTEITQSATSFLSKANKKGFFLMVEGGKIDWSCHANDAATTLREVVDFNDAIKVAYEFYKKHPKETLIVVTADHETGGLALGTGSSSMQLKALKHQKQSLDVLSRRISELRKQKEHQVTWEEIKELLGETMGFWKELPIEWKYEKMLRDSYEESFSKAGNLAMEESLYTKLEPVAAKAKDVMNSIACISWASTNHSAGYIPIYAIGAGSELFKGKMDNIDIPKRIAQAGGYK